MREEREEGCGTGEGRKAREKEKRRKARDAKVVALVLEEQVMESSVDRAKT